MNVKILRLDRVFSTIIIALLILINFQMIVPGEAGNSTVITSLPYTITSPGVYVLESDLTSTGDGIIVLSANVTILGKGYSITGSGNSNGINVSSVRGNVIIKDIIIRNFNTGIYIYDVYTDAYEFSGLVLENIIVENSTYQGIYVKSVYYNGLLKNVKVIGGTSPTYTYGIYIDQAEGFTILHTTVIGQNIGDYGIYIDNSYGVYIYDTHVERTHYESIYIEDNEYTTIVL